MISDSLRVALISETLEASSLQRRRAARILLDLSRSDRTFDRADRPVAAVREQAGAAVAAEAHWLLEKLGVFSGGDPA
jgi:hypothetical protein